MYRYTIEEKMIEVGRVCIKIAGRDAGKRCVVIKEIDKNYVLVDGFTRRKKVNIKHLLPLPKVVKVNEKTTKEEIQKLII